ncbi:MAG: glutathione S-transferase, partial [Luminiphilus sp.]|nr:glutathione S-transferase [Luminiphilus sp.]
MNHYHLWGMPASLWTGKARSYLRKKQIPFTEHAINQSKYLNEIVPAVGRFILPVLECPDGSLVQDSSDIIEYLDQHERSDRSIFLGSSVLDCIGHLFELFGGEGMLRPAMHYRWNFDEINLDFLRSEFSTSIGPVGSTDEEYDAVFDFSSGRMRKVAVSWGVTSESIPLVEASFKEFLNLFSNHLRAHPYLLGSKPSIGDFGLIAPLFAHLGRDPAPALLIKQTAPRVSRWIERMNSPEEKWAEYSEHDSMIDASNLPDTLLKLMAYIAEEYLAEITAHVEFTNTWLAERPDLEAGTNGLDKPGTRFIGSCNFEWRGIELQTSVLPYRFYLLQRIQDCYDQASKAEQRAIEAIFEQTGLLPLLLART